MKNRVKLASAAVAAAFSLTGCYVVPVGPDGYPRFYVPVEPTANPGQPQAQPRASGQPAAPAALQARLAASFCARSLSRRAASAPSSMVRAT